MMSTELPDRRKRNPDRTQPQVHSINRRSGKWSALPAENENGRPLGFQGKTIRAVPSEGSTGPSSLQDVSSIIPPTSNLSSPALPDHSGWDKPTLDPVTSFYHAPDDGQIRLSSSQFNDNVTRGGLHSSRANHSLGAKYVEDASNSIGYPSIIPSSKPLQKQVTRHPGTRKLHRLVKQPPTSSPTDRTHDASELEPRLPATKPDSTTILPLMKTTSGRMHGFLYFRPANSKNWSSGYCAINVTSGSLTRQAQGDPPVTKILIPDLRGCRVRTLYDDGDECNYISVSTATSGLRLNLWPPVAETLDSWLAALLCWQPLRSKGFQNKMPKPQPPLMVDHRTSDKYRPSDASTTKMPAIIKVGKMLLYTGEPAAGAVRTIPTRRISTYKQLRAISQSWRRVSCTLLDNGLFKLLTESDAQLISVVHLPSLSRHAVQQLHPSVLEDEFTMAIYPQYVTQPQSEVQAKPIYLSLESRILLEVWYVLLRSFAVSYLYGPEQLSPEQQPSDRNADSNPCSTSEHGLFRIERSLSIKITQAKLTTPLLPGKPRHYNMRGSKTVEANGEEEFYAEIVLDGEPRGRTPPRKQDNMFWVLEYTFDLPLVLSSALVQLRVANATNRQRTLSNPSRTHLGPASSDFPTLAGDKQLPSTDMVFGQVELQLEDLEPRNDMDRRWSIRDSTDTEVGNLLMKVNLTDTVILMKEDYSPLLNLLRHFPNKLTVTVAKTVPSVLKQLAELFLDIFQVSGDVVDWLMTLVEDEIDGIHQEDSTQQSYKKKLRSLESYEPTTKDRDHILRDLAKAATLEGNLLFRGNTLLTKALDAHMRRLGRDYLEETIGEQIRDIDESDPDCEVDPNRVNSEDDLARNWGNLMTLTTSLWTAIVSSVERCPADLRRILRHIQSCAETRYGDFSRSVSYSSVSGFLFLRFFCPAILNPRVFDLLKDNPRPRAQRALTLIAKSLQGLANMSTFGAKETWMEPMNRFLKATRREFKDFIDQICAIPSERRSQAVPASYATPIHMLARLSPPSREGFASLPYLIDSPRSFALLVSLWQQNAPQDLQGKLESDSAFCSFYDLCHRLDQATRDCLTNAEPAEKPAAGGDPRWERLMQEQETVTTFYEDSGSVPATPVAEVMPDVFASAGPAKRGSVNLSLKRGSSHDRIEPVQAMELESPTSAVSSPADYGWQPPPPQPQATTGSGRMRPSDMSPPRPQDLTEPGPIYESMGERGTPSKSRLFRDFVSGSTRRRPRDFPD